MRTARRVLSGTVAIAATAALLTAGATAAWAAPGNDNYANRSGLGSGWMTGAAGTNVGATSESGEWAGYGSNPNTVWYTWTASQSGAATFDTCVHDYDTIVAVYAGAGGTMPTTPTAYNDDGCNGLGSKVNLAVTSGVTYAIQVSGYYGSTGTFLLSINGGTAVAADEVDNTPPPMYQAYAKGSAACDAANGWSESWQNWVRDGLGGQVCERTIVFFNSVQRWEVARFNPEAGVYEPVDGASTGFDGPAATTKVKLTA